MKAPEYREPREEHEKYLGVIGHPLCACNRMTMIPGQNRCVHCIEESFVACAEEFRAAVSQGNLQESAT